MAAGSLSGTAKSGTTEVKSYLNGMWIGGKKKAMDAAIFMLVALVAVLTFTMLMAIFRIWTSAGSILAAVGRESQSVEPSDWYRIAAI